VNRILSKNPEDQPGRRATTNACALYLIATVFVGFCAQQGILRPWTLLPESMRHPGTEITLIALLTGLLVWRHLRAGSLDHPSRKDPAPDPYVADEDQALSEPPLPSPSQRLRITPEVGCWPLWNDETGDNLDPARLPIPADLVEELMRWDAKYQAAFDYLNPGAGAFPTREAEVEFRAEAKALASSLRTVWLGGVALQLDPTADTCEDSSHTPRDRGCEG
jgi:hypothetical protein